MDESIFGWTCGDSSLVCGLGSLVSLRGLHFSATSAIDSEGDSLWTHILISLKLALFSKMIVCFLFLNCRSDN